MVRRDKRYVTTHRTLAWDRDGSTLTLELAMPCICKPDLNLDYDACRRLTDEMDRAQTPEEWAVARKAMIDYHEPPMIFISEDDGSAA